MSKNIYDKVLDKKQMQMVHNNSVRILSEIGTDIYNEEALRILCSAGAEKTGPKTVRIPERLINDAIASSPHEVDLYDRGGNHAISLKGDNSYFGMGPTCPYVMDPYTGERRLFRKQDCVNGTRVGDYLENIDFIMSMGTISDAVIPKYFEVDAFYTMISNTNKPLIISATDMEDLSIIYEMSCALRGGEQELREKPLYVQYCEPITPLKHPDSSLRKLMFCSEKGIPVIYTPAPSAGGAAPVTLAGCLSVGNAEILTGLVLNQLIHKGAPFIYGGVFSILDMRTMNFSYASPEFLLFIGALSDMSKYYGLPSFTTGGVSDAKTFDEQAAGEYALSLMISYMSGSNLIHDIGYLEYGLTGCYEGMIYADEMIGMIKRLNSGIEVTENTLAFDAVKEAGIGGYFLNSDFTFDNYKKEQWSPNIIDRKTYSAWDHAGRKPLKKILNEKAIAIIESYKGHPLDPAMDEKIKKIMSGYDNC